MDKIVLDRKTIKALGVQTRLEILKLLSEKERTQSEIADELSMSAPTIKSHLEELEEAGLIKKEKTQRKWKYYRITFKGKRIINPYETKVVFSLFASLIIALVSIYKLATKRVSSMKLDYQAVRTLSSKAVTTTTLKKITFISQDTVWFTLLIISTIAFIALGIYLIKKHLIRKSTS